MSPPGYFSEFGGGATEVLSLCRCCSSEASWAGEVCSQGPDLLPCRLRWCESSGFINQISSSFRPILFTFSSSVVWCCLSSSLPVGSSYSALSTNLSVQHHQPLCRLQTLTSSSYVSVSLNINLSVMILKGSTVDHIFASFFFCDWKSSKPRMWPTPS